MLINALTNVDKLVKCYQGKRLQNSGQHSLKILSLARIHIKISDV